MRERPRNLDAIYQRGLCCLTALQVDDGAFDPCFSLDTNESTEITNTSGPSHDTGLFQACMKIRQQASALIVVVNHLKFRAVNCECAGRKSIASYCNVIHSYHYHHGHVVFGDKSKKREASKLL